MQTLAQLPRANSADRTQYLGASECAAVLGLDPYRTPFGVWAGKQADAPALDDSTVLQRGRFLERGVIEWCAHELGASDIEAGVALGQPGIVGPAPWLAVRPDGVLHFEGGASMLVEAKTSDAEGFVVEGREDVPEHYAVQCLMQLACVPVERVVVPAYLPIRRRFVRPVVERDDALIVELLERLDAWWYAHCDPHGPLTAPPLDASEASATWVKRSFPRESAGMRAATEDEARLVSEWAATKALLDETQSATNALKHALQAAIGDHEGLTIDGGKVTWKAQAGANRLDAKLLRERFPEAAAACTVQGEPTRVLRSTLKG